jgi:hypothetical protein
MSVRIWRGLAAFLAAVLLNVCALMVLTSSIYTPPDVPAPRVVQTLLRFSMRKIAWVPSAVIDVRLHGVAPRSSASLPRLEIESGPANKIEFVGFGWLMTDCDPDRLYRLTQDQKNHCPTTAFWHMPKPSNDFGLNEVDSSFAEEVADRRRPAVPIEHPCSPAESPNSNLGIPCHTFPTGVVTSILKKLR